MYVCVFVCVCVCVCVCVQPSCVCVCVCFIWLCARYLFFLFFLPFPLLLSCPVLFFQSFLFITINIWFVLPTGASDRRMLFDINLPSAPGLENFVGEDKKEQEWNIRGVRWRRRDKENLFIHCLTPQCHTTVASLFTLNPDSHTQAQLKTNRFTDRCANTLDR